MTYDLVINRGSNLELGLFFCVDDEKDGFIKVIIMPSICYHVHCVCLYSLPWISIYILAPKNLTPFTLFLFFFIFYDMHITIYTM